MNKKSNVPPLMQIFLEQQTAPRVQEARGKEWIEYGIHDNTYGNNNYPQFLLDLYYGSGIHASIINSTADMIAGESFIVEDNSNVETYAKLKQFLAKANSKESVHEVMKKVAHDLKLFGSYAINLIWSRDRQTIAELHHVSVAKVRIGKPNDLGKIDTYYISSDWNNYRKKENNPYSIPAFNPNDRSNPSVLLYGGRYSAGMDMYSVPDYLSCTNFILCSQHISEYHLSNISNGFSPSFWINMNNGIPSAEERMEIENSIKRKFTGSTNAGKFVLSFNDDANRKPDIQPIQVSNADKQYTVLNELVNENIMVGHRITSPMLLGIRTAGQLGGRNEILEAYELYLKSVVQPYQNILLSALNKILDVNNLNLPISIEQYQPIGKYGIDTLKEVLTRDEIRAELGLEPLDVAEEVIAEHTDKHKEKYAKVGDIDGLPVYDTIEEAEAKAKELGCSGYHVHNLNGKDVYMPCADHAQITNLSLSYTPSDKEVITYIDNLNLEQEDDLNDEWELIEEDKVDCEEEDKNNIELAINKGAIQPSGKAGVSRYDSRLYKIRYVYRGGAPIATSREFCRHMWNKHYGSLFTRDDITKMTTSRANTEFGYYSIFRFKGSYNCRHYWLRRLYVLKKAPKKMIIDNVEYKKGDYLPTDKLSNYYPRNKGYIPQDAGVPKLDYRDKEAGSTKTQKV